MPNNEDKNKEDLAESQAEKRIRGLLDRLDQGQAKHDAERSELDALRKEGESRLAEAALREKAVSGRETAVMDAQQDLISGQQLLNAKMNDLAEKWDAERAILLGKISSLIEANAQANARAEQASAREASRDAVIDSYGQSFARIEQGVSMTIPELMKESTVAFNAGLDRITKELSSSNVLSNQVVTAIENVGSRQEDIFGFSTTRFSSLDQQVSAVQVGVDRIGNMVTTLHDFIVNIREMLTSQKAQFFKFESELFSLKAHTKDLVGFQIEKVIKELSKFTQIPGKMEIQIKNLNSIGAKIKGETDAVTEKYAVIIEGIIKRLAVFEKRLDGLADLGDVLREEIKTGTKVGLGRFRSEITEFIQESMNEIGSAIKKSEMYGVVGELHSIVEKTELLNVGSSQLISEIGLLATDIDGSVKRNFSDLKEQSAVISKSMLGDMNEVRNGVHDLNGKLSDSLAHLDMWGGSISKTNQMLAITADKATTLMGTAAQIGVQVGKEFLAANTKMFGDLPDLLAHRVLDLAAEAKNELILNELNEKDPE